VTTLRIGHLPVYFGLFDEAMPSGFRSSRDGFRSTMHELLAAHGDVVDPGLVDDADSAKAAGVLFASEKVDVIVFAPTMAAPPGWAWNAIDSIDVPVIAVGAQEYGTVPPDYDTETATARSLPVGLVMFTNVLVRRGRPFVTVVGELSAPELKEQLAVALRAAAARSRIRRSPLLAIGEAIEGYDDVMADGAELQALGVRSVPVSRPELDAAFAAVNAGRVLDLAADARRTTDASAVADDVLQRSCRLALALEDLVETHEACGGAVNCHGPLLRRNPVIGVTACLGVSFCSTQGLPFACTGDIPTAIALVVGKVLTGSALYCELYQLDLVGDWILVANGGEGDLTSCEPGTPVRLLPEDHYAGERGAGTAVAFELARGAATVMSLSPVAAAPGGWVLVVAEGEILDSRHPTMDGPNGMFRFSSGPVAEAFGRWCAAGATHHAVVLRGHRRTELQILTDLLGILLRTA
jgi:L-arabinose isomerase